MIVSEETSSMAIFIGHEQLEGVCLFEETNFPLPNPQSAPLIYCGLNNCCVTKKE